MKRRSPSSSSRPDRSAMERNRRNQMKALVSQLYSIVQQHGSPGPSSSSSGTAPVPDQLEGATKYIKSLQIRVERLKEKKQSLMINGDPDTRGAGSMAPKVEIRTMGTVLEVTLITGSDSQLIFKEMVRVLEEEGAEILNVAYSSTGDAILHSIRCEVGDWEFTPFTCDWISERLRDVVSLHN